MTLHPELHPTIRAYRAPAKPGPFPNSKEPAVPGPAHFTARYHWGDDYFLVLSADDLSGVPDVREITCGADLEVELERHGLTIDDIRNDRAGDID